MKFENEYGKVDINIVDNNVVAVNVSGGADSALLLWMVSKSVKDQEIIIRVIDSDKRKILDEMFEKLIDNIKSLFPHINYSMSYTYTDETIRIYDFLRLKPKNTTQIFTGLTSNAPIDVQVELNIDKNRDENRDQDKMSFPDNYDGIYWPMRFTDKRFLKKMCDDNHLQFIHDFTWTCTAVSPEIRPCKECVDCKERFMLIGTYDYGQT